MAVRTVMATFYRLVVARNKYVTNCQIIVTVLNATSSRFEPTGPDRGGSNQLTD